MSIAFQAAIQCTAQRFAVSASVGITGIENASRGVGIGRMIAGLIARS